MKIDISAPTPSTLSELAGDVRVAREEVRALRAVPVIVPDLLSARETLLRAMEAYADELTARHLPIPPQLRDDLRLQRDIRRRPTGRTWPYHR
jgi:hypothetical protein